MSASLIPLLSTGANRAIEALWQVVQALVVPPASHRDSVHSPSPRVGGRCRPSIACVSRPLEPLLSLTVSMIGSPRRVSRARVPAGSCGARRDRSSSSRLGIQPSLALSDRRTPRSGCRPEPTRSRPSPNRIWIGGRNLSSKGSRFAGPSRSLPPTPTGCAGGADAIHGIHEHRVSSAGWHTAARAVPLLATGAVPRPGPNGRTRKLKVTGCQSPLAFEGRRV